MTADRSRLLVTGLTWPPEPFIGQLLAGLRAGGVHLIVASGANPGSEADDWVPMPGGSGLPLHSLAALGRRSPAGGARAIRRYASQRRGGGGRATLGLELIASAHADVLYLPWTATAIEHPELFDVGPPVIVSCRGSHVNVAPWNPDRSHLAAGLPEAFRRASLVHCVSTAIREEAALHGLDVDKARVVRPAVDTDRLPLRPTRRNGPPLRLLTVGTMTWRKGIEFALLAVRRLLDDEVAVTYDIVGAEADGGATRHAIDDLRLGAHVTLSGPLPWTEMPGRFAAADVLVHPSLSEGIANVVLEAMATGRPVVVTDCGGMREVVDDGVEGRIVPVRDAGALADAIHSLADPDRREASGRAGRRRVENDLALPAQVTAFADLVHEARERGR